MIPSDPHPRSHPRSTTYPGRIPAAGLIPDLADLIYDALWGGCAECETEGPSFDDAAELTLDIVKFLQDNGIELDR